LIVDELKEQESPVARARASDLEMDVIAPGTGTA